VNFKICIEVDDEPQKPTKRPIHFIIYPVFASISVFFLLLLLIVFFLVPEMRNLQGKCIACHSATLAIGLFGLAVTHTTGKDSDENICVVFGKPDLHTLVTLNVKSFYGGARVK